MKKIGIIGFGNMGKALYEGLLQFSELDDKDFITSHPNIESRTLINQDYAIECVPNNIHLAKESELIILAVKPQILGKVLQEIAPVLDVHQTLISCAAGYNLKQIEQVLDKHIKNIACIRIMPNIAVKVGAGVNVFACNAAANSQTRDYFMSLFSALGLNIELPESQFDAATGLSGSGPAFIYTMMEAMIDAGVKVGLSRQHAKAMVKQTFFGSSALINATGKHPGQLKDLITSPGGTAITGIYTLEKGGVRHSLIEAVEAAAKKAKELSI